MKQEIQVPEVGESITEGVLVEWLVEDGAQIQADDPLFELETDKITLEVPSPVGGVVRVEVAAGETVQVGQRVAVVDTDAVSRPVPGGAGEEASPATADPRPNAPAKPVEVPGAASVDAATATAPAAGAALAADSGSPMLAASTTYAGVPGFGPSTPGALGRLGREVPSTPFANLAPASSSMSLDSLSPAVRRMVQEYQIDPAQIRPSGPGGRITKGDVLTYLGEQAGQGAPSSAGAPPPFAAAPGSSPAAPPPSPAAPPPSAAAPLASAAAPSASTLAPGGGARQTRAKMTPIRARIAERLVQAKREAAMLTTFNEVDMSRILALRKQLQDPFEKQHGRRLGFMSFFVKAVVDALHRVPGLNAFIDGNEIVTNHFYDIGVAVGTDRGLVVPVVRGCDRLGYAEIEAEIADLARRVRDKKIGLEDLQGGCFTLSNGGIYGSLLSTPILNPPQSGILGMHAIKKRPVVLDDEIVIRPMMYLALSYDHRIVDGKDAVLFLKRVVECLEAPERMLLDA